MHTLSVAKIRVQLAKDKEDVQHHALCVRLAKVEVLGHAAVDVLLDFGAEFFVLTDGRPW
jgi:hypothetical protein